MTAEIFAKPCAAAIIEKHIDGEPYILMQTRQKENDRHTNGMLEIPAGKIREYENIYMTLRREVREETGLTVTEIQGEEKALSIKMADAEIISYEPYCITQNLSGAYSIILHTFLCRAEGTLLTGTNETENIHWMKVKEVRELVEKSPDRIFFMHIIALKKYLRQTEEYCAE